MNYNTFRLLFNHHISPKKENYFIIYSTLMLIQTNMSLYELNLYKNVGNQTVDSSHFVVFFFHTMVSQWLLSTHTGLEHF